MNRFGGISVARGQEMLRLAAGSTEAFVNFVRSDSATVAELEWLQLGLDALHEAGRGTADFHLKQNALDAALVLDRGVPSRDSLKRIAGHGLTETFNKVVAEYGDSFLVLAQMEQGLTQQGATAPDLSARRERLNRAARALILRPH